MASFDEMRESMTSSQRLEYGVYQFIDHFLGRQTTFSLFGGSRRRLYKRIGKTLQSQGKGRILDIPRVKNPSLEQVQQIIEAGKPVVLEGFASDWPCVQKWSPQYFKELHGTDEILILDSKHIDAEYERITLADLIDNIQSGGSKYYRFYPLLSEHPEHLADFDYNWLKAVRHKKVFFEAFQVFMGGKGTESPMHNAMQCNLFVQVYGEKRWSILSPKYTAIIDPDPVRNVYRGAPFRKNNEPWSPFRPDYEKPYELYEYVDRYDFVLKPGDILFNPPFWWHSVINQTDSIGVGYRWVNTSYSFRKNFLYTLLDHFATNPPMRKGYALTAKDVNLLHLAEDGRLNKYLSEQQKKTEEAVSE